MYRYLDAAGTIESAFEQMASRALPPKVAINAVMTMPHPSATHSASDSTSYASCGLPEASAEAKSDVVATFSQKKRYAPLSVSILAGPSAASSLAEHVPTIAVSITVIISELIQPASVGTMNLKSSSVLTSFVGHESMSEGATAFSVAAASLALSLAGVTRGIELFSGSLGCAE